MPEKQLKTIDLKISYDELTYIIIGLEMLLQTAAFVGAAGSVRGKWITEFLHECETLEKLYNPWKRKN